MKLGLGLYLNVLTCDNLDSPPQAGATHLVVHLVDYFAGASLALQPPLAYRRTRSTVSSCGNSSPTFASAWCPYPLRQM